MNHKEDWFYEGQISRKLVKYFKSNGYNIVKDNSDKISLKGEDIIVECNGEYEIIEVKGYPTTYYTQGPKKGLPKKTNPKLQAKHWFSEAVLSSFNNYKRHRGKDSFRIALAFPLVERYKELIAIVEDYFTDNNISLNVYFVNKDGQIIIDNLNKNDRK